MKYEASPDMRGHMDRIFRGEYDLKGLGFNAAPVILDIGANIGCTTWWYAQRFPGATIHAYEPQPDNAKLWHKHIEQNSVPNAQLTEAIVYPTSDPTMSLWISQVNNGMHSIQKTMTSTDDAKSIDVPTLRPAKLPQADIIKVDTEGCEVGIIGEYIRTHHLPTVISFEFHCAEDRLALEDLLREHYVLYSGEILFPQIGTLNYLRRGISGL